MFDAGFQGCHGKNVDLDIGEQDSRMNMHPSLIQYLPGKRLSYLMSFLIAGIVVVVALSQWKSMIGSLKNIDGY